jgi:hypothetical protein
MNKPSGRPRKVALEPVVYGGITACEVREMITEALEPYKILLAKKGGSNINKVETFNGEEIPDQAYGISRMNFDEQIYSVLNAIKILPPNMIVDGRHSIDNVQAINGSFKVTEEHMDVAYSQFKHEAF